MPRRRPAVRPPGATCNLQQAACTMPETRRLLCRREGVSSIDFKMVDRRCCGPQHATCVPAATSRHRTRYNGQQATCTVLATTGTRRCPSPAAMAPKANEQIPHFRHALAEHRRWGSCSRIIVRVCASRTAANKTAEAIHFTHANVLAVAPCMLKRDGSLAQAALLIEARFSPEKSIAASAVP